MATDKPVIPPRVRDYAYPILTAIVLLLGGYGVVSGEHVPLWLALAAAVLGGGTATAYRPARTIPDGTGRYRADQ